MRPLTDNDRELVDAVLRRCHAFGRVQKVQTLARCLELYAENRLAPAEVRFIAEGIVKERHLTVVR